MNEGSESPRVESAAVEGAAAFFAKYPRSDEPMTPATLRAYFERLWILAAPQAASVAERLPLGGNLALRVTFSRVDLRGHLRPAFAHLLEPDGPAQAEVRISAPSGSGHLQPPWQPEDYGPRGEVQGLEGTPYRAIYNSDSACLSFCDLQTRRAIVWLRDSPGRLPVYERAAPLLAILPRLLAPTLETAEPRLMVHGGAVGTADGALLLAGRGGSGKSTTALAALCAGMDYLADDYCLLHLAPSGPQVRSLYASAKVDGPMLERLPQLRERGLVVEGMQDGEKHLLQLASRCHGQIATSRPLRALVLPRVESGRGPHSATSGATPAEALRALAPSTIFQLGGAARRRCGCWPGWSRKCRRFTCISGRTSRQSRPPCRNCSGPARHECALTQRDRPGAPDAGDAAGCGREHLGGCPRCFLRGHRDRRRLDR